MDTGRLLRLLAICFTAACLWTTSRAFHIDMPASVKPVEGSCVLIPCQTDSHTRVIWYKYQSRGWPVVYDAQRPEDVLLDFKGRTSMPGSPSEGNCTLRINNIRMSDDITVFPYINPESNKYYNPNVGIKPQARTTPAISVSKSPVKEGEVFNLSCSIQHSCPPSPPSIEWRGLSVSSPEVSTETQDAGMWVTVSTVRLTAAHDQHGRDVHCCSIFSDGNTTESQPLTLDISYAPVNVKLGAEKDITAERDTTTLKCLSKSNPQPNFYQWFIKNGSDSFQVNSSKDHIIVTDVQRDFSAACSAQNRFGTGQSAKTFLNVVFVTIISSDSFCSETGRMLRCVCRAEANPTATITWKLNGSAKLPAFVIPTVTTRGRVRSSEVTLEGELADQRPVVCVATNQYGAETQQMALREANVSLPDSFLWIVLGCALGFLGLCGLICFCCHSRKRTSDHSGLSVGSVPPRNGSDGSLSININMQRPEAEVKAKAKRPRAPRPPPPEIKLCDVSKKDVSVEREEFAIYDNETCFQTQKTPQGGDLEEIYINNDTDEDAENIYLNS
ncbi:hypothetical protein ACEWY4_019592 [Coilia grayii]|uniref:Ig-like domain-containing protein n=1 Tax=Coilia grayii TaxID=363190 RepID=A0ABD1JAI1_9TELE